MVKDPPAMWESWVRSLGWEDPLEESMATHSSVLAWRIPIDRGAWQATDCKESDTTEQLKYSTARDHIVIRGPQSVCRTPGVNVSSDPLSSRSFLKFLLNLLQYCFCFMYWFFSQESCGTLASQPGIKPTPLVLEGEVLTTETPGKSPCDRSWDNYFLFLFQLIYIWQLWIISI